MADTIILDHAWKSAKSKVSFKAITPPAGGTRPLLYGTRRISVFYSSRLLFCFASLYFPVAGLDDDKFGKINSLHRLSADCSSYTHSSICTAFIQSSTSGFQGNLWELAPFVSIYSYSFAVEKILSFHVYVDLGDIGFTDPTQNHTQGGSSSFTPSPSNPFCTGIKIYIQ